METRRVGFFRQVGLGIRLAWADFVHEWRMATCLILALAAVLAPLMVLFGLKFGVVETLRTRLVEDPRNLQVIPIGSGKFDREWFDAARKRPDVGFVVPRTRSIATTIKLRKFNGGPWKNVDLIPTDSGDPLLSGIKQLPPPAGRAIVSSEVARVLKVQAGDDIEVLVRRVVDGRRQAEKLRFQVDHVLPRRAYAKAGLFVPLTVLVAIEEYRDGYGVERYGWPGRPPRDVESDFASYRMFAANVDAVISLEKWLRGVGLDVHTKAAEVSRNKALARNLAAAFLIIAALGSGGYMFSLAVNLWANVDRKRREFSILRLLGWQTLGVVCFPVFQGVLIAVFGVGVASGFFYMARLVINTTFADSLVNDREICRLLPEHYLWIMAITLAVSFSASCWAGYRAARIEPAEEIRNV